MLQESNQLPRGWPRAVITNTRPTGISELRGLFDLPCKYNHPNKRSTVRTVNRRVCQWQTLLSSNKMATEAPTALSPVDINEVCVVARRSAIDQFNQERRHDDPPSLLVGDTTAQCGETSGPPSGLGWTAAIIKSLDLVQLD
ncbi:hypothetical protein RRG08_064974 [Elysia crispata]|uniref:Uncharacterized protein n=1 Tax=Elysia crispata TaxID=231223 RepID=A0AAE1CV18_9GAST|nr:hypothetical protein RRG08_064974 [Elysia crispata]